MNAWLDARKKCQNMCQKFCQSICQKECQIECQGVCQKEWYCNIWFQMVCQKLCQHSLSGSASLEEFNVQSSLVHMMCHQPRKPTMKSKWPRLHRAWAKQHKATRLKGPQLFPPFSWSRQNADFLLRSNFHLRRGPWKRTMFWHLSKFRRCVRNRLDHWQYISWFFNCTGQTLPLCLSHGRPSTSF